VARFDENSLTIWQPHPNGEHSRRSGCEGFAREPEEMLKFAYSEPQCPGSELTFLVN